MTVVQSLHLTLAIAPIRIVVLDTLRRQRNVSDYTDDEIDLSTVEHCITEAVKLIDEVLEWRSQNRPALIAK